MFFNTRDETYIFCVCMLMIYMLKCWIVDGRDVGAHTSNLDVQLLLQAPILPYCSL